MIMLVAIARARGNRYQPSPGLPVIAGDAHADPVVTMRLHDKTLYHSLFLNGKLTLGEAYTDGTLTFEEGSGVHDFLNLLVQNQASVAPADSTPFAGANTH